MSVSYYRACLELLELHFQFSRSLMDLPDKSHILEMPSQSSENLEAWEQGDLQSLFDITYYFNHTQLQTEITS